MREPDWFKNIDAVITEPLKFKAKLAIGEDAYASLRLKNAVFEAWDTFGVEATAATFAKSTAVASTFFAPTGFLAAIGIGTAATPIGWLIAASVVSGGAWMGITRYIKNNTNNMVTVIPEFINTPIDVLGLGLFDLIAPLALKIANVDGNIDVTEKELIHSYFVNEWGYDKDFVDAGIAFTESNISEYSIKAVAKTLADYKIQNPDCNYKVMSKEILSFLQRIIEADGRIDEREEMALEAVKGIFDSAGKVSISKVSNEKINKIKSFIVKKFKKS